MGDVTPLIGTGAMTPAQVRALHDFDAAIVAAIEACKGAGVMQGLIVGLLHARAQQETATMLDL
jgi:hypothetical protein